MLQLLRTLCLHYKEVGVMPFISAMYFVVETIGWLRRGSWDLVFSPSACGPLREPLFDSMSVWNKYLCNFPAAPSVSPIQIFLKMKFRGYKGPLPVLFCNNFRLTEEWELYKWYTYWPCPEIPFTFTTCLKCRRLPWLHRNWASYSAHSLGLVATP